MLPSLLRAPPSLTVLRGGGPGGRSIAQGCSEYNITILINQSDSVRALRAVHGCFFLAQLPLALGIVGPGAIGSTLLAQLHTQAQVRSQ